MRRTITWLAIVAVAVAAALAGTGSAVAGDDTTQVDGIQTLISFGNPFDPADDVYRMEATVTAARHSSARGTRGRSSPESSRRPGSTTATGTEEFDGCLDANGDGSCGAGEPAGTLSFNYKFSGKYDPITFAQQHGRCHHPITGGTGDFARASGVLRFKDDPAIGCSYYSGHLTLGG